MIVSKPWRTFPEHDAKSTEARMELRAYLDSNDCRVAFTRLGLAVPTLNVRLARGSNNTDRCYLGDQLAFLAKCAPDGQIENVNQAQSLQFFRELRSSINPTQPLRASTVERKMYAVRKLYWERGLPSPTNLTSHRQLIRELRRADRRTTKKAKPLFGEAACSVASSFAGDDLRGLRDAAICALGTQRGFRASTIVGLDIENQQFDPRGVVLGIVDDKTHKSGNPLRTAMRHSEDHRACAACALRFYCDALKELGIQSGALFRHIDRWGNVRDRHLRPSSVTSILRRALIALGSEDANTYSSHSFRHGVVHAGIISGMSIDEICSITLHRSKRGIMPYISAIDPWYFSIPRVPLTFKTTKNMGNQGWVHAAE